MATQVIDADQLERELAALLEVEKFPPPEAFRAERGRRKPSRTSPPKRAMRKSQPPHIAGRCQEPISRPSHHTTPSARCQSPSPSTLRAARGPRSVILWASLPGSANERQHGHDLLTPP